MGSYSAMEFGIILLVHVVLYEVYANDYAPEPAPMNWDAASAQCTDDTYSLVPGRSFRASLISRQLQADQTIWVRGFKVVTDPTPDSENRVRSLKVDYSRSSTKTDYPFICKRDDGTFYIHSGQAGSKARARKYCEEEVGTKLAHLRSWMDIQDAMDVMADDQPYWVNSVTTEEVIKLCLAGRKVRNTLKYYYESCKAELDFICLKDTTTIKKLAPLVAMKQTKFDDVQQAIEDYRTQYRTPVSTTKEPTTTTEITTTTTEKPTTTTTEEPTTTTKQPTTTTEAPTTTTEQPTTTTEEPITTTEQPITTTTTEPTTTTTEEPTTTTESITTTTTEKPTTTTEETITTTFETTTTIKVPTTTNKELSTTTHASPTTEIADAVTTDNSMEQGSFETTTDFSPVTDFDGYVFTDSVNEVFPVLDNTTPDTDDNADDTDMDVYPTTEYMPEGKTAKADSMDDFLAPNPEPDDTDDSSPMSEQTGDTDPEVSPESEEDDEEEPAVEGTKGQLGDDDGGIGTSLWIALIVLFLAVCASLIIAFILYRRRKHQKSKDINPNTELREKTPPPPTANGTRESTTFKDEKAYDL